MASIACLPAFSEDSKMRLMAITLVVWAGAVGTASAEEKGDLTAGAGDIIRSCSASLSACVASCSRSAGDCRSECESDCEVCALDFGEEPSESCQTKRR
jgi:hypothetical protein